MCNRLYFNVLQFTLEIESGAGTAMGGTAAGGGEALGDEGRAKGGEALGDEGSAERGNWFFRPRPEKLFPPHSRVAADRSWVAGGEA